MVSGRAGILDGMGSIFLSVLGNVRMNTAFQS